MKRWSIWLTIILILSVSPALGKGKVPTAGDFFPEFSFPQPPSRGDAQYLGVPAAFLGLGRGDAFSLKDIKADLILVEYMNKYCFSCQLQAPVLNRAYEMVGSDPHLRGRVKFIGIAAGNNQKEVESFKNEKKVPFPIILDPKFLAYEAIGDPGATPFMLLVRKTDSGNLVVTRAKVGLNRDAASIIGDMNASLQADWLSVAQQRKDSSIQESKAKKLQVPFSEEQLLKKAQESMASPKWKVMNVAKVKLSDEEEIYIGEVQSGGQKSFLFAKLASRAPTCDLCHATHFIFTFNDKGMIINFHPLQATKLNNVAWDEKDIASMKQRLVGRSILEPVDFDPQVDTVATATMTAALVVDSINRAKDLYQGLKSKGYVK